MKCIHGVMFRKEHRCFKANDIITLRHGINLIVGDQGCGKSTFLDAVRNARETVKDGLIYIHSDNVQIGGFDFEKENPRTQTVFGGMSGKMDVGFQVSSLYQSHGQSSKAILEGLGKAKDTVMLLDEPDTALSVRSVRRLCELFDDAVKNGCQIIAACHNPILMVHAQHVYSMEHRQWMPSDTFLYLMSKQPGHKVPCFRIGACEHEGATYALYRRQDETIDICYPDVVKPMFNLRMGDKSNWPDKAREIVMKWSKEYMESQKAAEKVEDERSHAEPGHPEPVRGGVPGDQAVPGVPGREGDRPRKAKSGGARARRRTD